MLGETEKSLDVCRTASLSETGYEQRAATSSTVTDQRRKNFFVRKYRSWSRYRQIAECCGSEMTSASRGKNLVAHHCKVDWCRLVKTLEKQQTDLVLQALLNGQPVQSISDVAGDVSRISVCAVSVEPLRSARSVVAGYKLHAHRRWHCYNNQYDWWQTHVRVTWRRLRLVIGEQSSAVVDVKALSREPSDVWCKSQLAVE